jgi:hypothetical protein
MNMANTHQRLVWLIAKGLINPADWYVITINPGQINLQGYYNNKLAHKLATEHKISMAIGTNGYIEGRTKVGRCHIDITLTS